MNFTKIKNKIVQFFSRKKENDKSKGLGDTIAKATKKVGIPPCGRCKKRQEKLNKMFPYK